MKKINKISLQYLLLLLIIPILFFIKLPRYLLIFISFVFIIIIRQISKLISAYYSGDKYALENINFNLLKFIDPNGLLVLFVLIFLGSPFIVGFSKPLNIDINKFKNRDRGIFFQGLVPLVITILFSFISLKLGQYISINNLFLLNFSNILTYNAIIGISLTVYNFIPLPLNDTFYMIYVIADDDLRRILNGFIRHNLLLSMIIIIFFYRSGIFSGIYNALIRLMI